jgi:hypothetical protein
MTDSLINTVAADLEVKIKAFFEERRHAGTVIIQLVGEFAPEVERYFTLATYVSVIQEVQKADASIGPGFDTHLNIDYDLMAYVPLDALNDQLGKPVGYFLWVGFYHPVKRTLQASTVFFFDVMGKLEPIPEVYRETARQYGKWHAEAEAHATPPGAASPQTTRPPIPMRHPFTLNKPRK